MNVVLNSEWAEVDWLVGWLVGRMVDLFLLLQVGL
jgi:hypothetical protein